jgi:hypothetical protein
MITIARCASHFAANAVWVLVGLGLVFSLRAETPRIVDDPVAAAELTAAYDKLQKFQTYRQKTFYEPPRGEPSVTEYQKPSRMRSTQPQRLGQWQGVSEWINVGARAAYRFVSPELDLHLAQMKAMERASYLVSMGGTLRQLMQALAFGGPIGLAAAAGQAHAAARGARDLAAEDPMELYGKWQCAPGFDFNAAPPAEAPGFEERVERLPSSTWNGEAVKAYRSVSVGQGWEIEFRSYASEKTGVLVRSEMLDPPGNMISEFYDFDAPITIELPDCR